MLGVGWRLGRDGGAGDGVDGWYYGLANAGDRPGNDTSVQRRDRRPATGLQQQQRARGCLYDESEQVGVVLETCLGKLTVQGR